MKRYDPDFKNKLTGIDFDTLEKSVDPVFGLSQNLELVYFNKAWIKFAKGNGGEPSITTFFPIGTPIQNAISGDLKDFYIQKYQEVLETNKVWEHKYECSSIEIFRIFHQITYPLKSEKGLIVINSLVVEKGITEIYNPATAFDDAIYFQKTGYINQCSNCRRTQRKKEPTVWDWVPEYINDRQEYASHTICPVCYDYYWKNPIKYKTYLNKNS